MFLFFYWMALYDVVLPNVGLINVFLFGIVWKGFFKTLRVFFCLYWKAIIKHKKD